MNTVSTVTLTHALPYKIQGAFHIVILSLTEASLLGNYDATELLK